MYVSGMHNCAESKEPPASLKATLAPEEQLNICDVFLGFGLYPGDALLGLGWCQSGCLFSEDEVSVQVYEEIDINLSKTQMIGPRTRLNLSGHETLPSAEEQTRQLWLGAPRAETAAAWVAEAQSEQIVGSNSKRLRVGPATPVYSQNCGESHL